MTLIVILARRQSFPRTSGKDWTNIRWKNEGMGPTKIDRILILVTIRWVHYDENSATITTIYYSKIYLLTMKVNVKEATIISIIQRYQIQLHLIVIWQKFTEKFDEINQ